MHSIDEFAMLVLNISLRPSQADVFNSIDNWHDFNYLSYPSKFGCSTILSMYAIVKSLEGKSKILVNEDLFENIYRIMAKSNLNHKTYNDRIEFLNKNEIHKLPVKHSQYNNLTDDQIEKFKGFDPTLIIVDNYIDPFFALSLRTRKSIGLGSTILTKYVASFPKYTTNSYEHLKKLSEWYSNKNTNECKITNVDFQILKEDR